VHDGAAFRVRDLRLGAHRLDDDDLALLHKCDGRSLDEALEQSKAPLERARALVERGLLVV
jgi:hypothetical protein